METSIGQNVESEVSEDSAALPAALPAGAENEPIALTGLTGASGIQGDFDRDDLVIPYLNVVAKTGNLSDTFTPGHIVYNKEVVVSDGKKPIIVTALSLKKYWEEKLDADEWGDVSARRFDSYDEALAEGYSKDYDSEKRVIPVASIMVLVPIDRDYASIEAPLNLHECIKEQTKRVFNGEPVFAYTRAIYIARGSAYRNVAMPLITATSMGHLRKGKIHHGGFALTTKLDSFKNNSWWAPKLSSAGKHTPEFIRWLDEEVIL